MSDDSMKQRAYAFAEQRGTLDEDALCDFAASEVRAALAPRQTSPELAEAEKWLHGFIAQVQSSLGHLLDEPAEHPKAIAAELDRLRAEVARLSQPAPAQSAEVERLRGLIRTAAQVGQQAAGGKETFTFDEWLKKVDELCDALKGGAPAQDRATRVVWVGAASEVDALDGVAYANRAVTTDEDEAVECDDGEEVFEVELRARKVTAERAGKAGT